MDVGEVLVYRRVLSGLERQRVEAYLAKKWSITMTVAPDTTTPLSAENGTFTTDVFDTLFVQQQFVAQNPSATAFVQRTINIDVDLSFVLTVSAKIVQVCSPGAWSLACASLCLAVPAATAVLGNSLLAPSHGHEQPCAAHGALCRVRLQLQRPATVSVVLQH